MRGIDNETARRLLPLLAALGVFGLGVGAGLAFIAFVMVAT